MDNYKAIWTFNPSLPEYYLLNISLFLKYFRSVSKQVNKQALALFNILKNSSIGPQFQLIEHKKVYCLDHLSP